LSKMVTQILEWTLTMGTVRHFPCVKYEHFDFTSYLGEAQ